MGDSEELLWRGVATPDFALAGTDGRTWRYADAAGTNGLAVMFICNHCPYVRAVIDRIVRDANALRELYEAMKQRVETGRAPQAQTASIGCSVKWKRG